MLWLTQLAEAEPGLEPRQPGLQSCGHRAAVFPQVRLPRASLCCAERGVAASMWRENCKGWEHRRVHRMCLIQGACVALSVHARPWPPLPRWEDLGYLSPPKRSLQTSQTTA